MTNQTSSNHRQAKIKVLQKKIAEKKAKIIKMERLIKNLQAIERKYYNTEDDEILNDLEVQIANL